MFYAKIIIIINNEKKIKVFNCEFNIILCIAVAQSFSRLTPKGVFFYIMP